MARILRDIAFWGNLKLTSAQGVVSRRKFPKFLFDTDETTFSDLRDEILALAPAGGSLELENNRIIITVERTDTEGNFIAPQTLPRKIEGGLSLEGWEVGRLEAVAFVSAIPSAPKNLAVEITSPTELTLTWEASGTPHTSTVLERSTDNVTFTPLAVFFEGELSYVDSGLAVGDYWYRTIEQSAAGDSEPSNTVHETLVTPAPAAPSGVSANVISESQIDVSWTNNAVNNSSIRVYISTDGVTWIRKLLTTVLNTTSFSITGLNASTTYSIRVSAYNSSGEAFSSTIQASTPAQPVPAAPTNLTATGVSTTQINLSWQDNATSESGFKIERSTDGVNFSEIATVGPNQTSYSDTGLPSNTTRYYQVRGFNSVGNTDYTNIASATTQTATPTSSPPASAPVLAVPTVVSDTRIDLAWTSPNSNDQATLIFCSEDGGASYRRLDKLAPGILSYQVRGLQPGWPYSFFVREVNDGGFSPKSTVRTVSTLAKVHTAVPDPPSSLSAIAASDTVISLEWYDTTGYDEDSVIVEESTNGGSTWTAIATLKPGETRYNRTGRTAATTYHYKIKTQNSVGDSTYSNTANATTLAVGVKLSPTGRNPLVGWDAHWQTYWTAAKAAYDATGLSTFPGKLWYRILSTMSGNLVGLGQMEAMAYQITGNATYANRALNYIYTGTGGGGLGWWLGLDATVASVDGANPKKIFTITLPAISPTSLETYLLWGRVFWETGANVDDQVPGALILAYNTTTNQVTLQTTQPNNIQVGDTCTILPQFKSGTYNINDSQRSLYMDICWMGDWLYPAMSATQKKRYKYLLASLADVALGNDSVKYKSGTNINDSDQASAHLWGVLLTEAGTFPEALPRAGDWLNATINSASGNAALPWGGYAATGVDMTTIRNDMSRFAAAARGGEWIESSEYNPDTFALIATGVECLRQLRGQQDAPEYQLLEEDVALNLVHSMTPDGLARMQWGDDGDNHVINSIQSSSYFNLAGVSRGNQNGKALFQAAVNLYNLSTSQQALYPLAFRFLNPGAGSFDLSSLAKTYYARGQGMLYYRTGWAANDSLLQLQQQQPNLGIHHIGPWFTNCQIYRKGEFALSFPIEYQSFAQKGEAKNSMTFAGQHAMEHRGPSKVEMGSDYAYMCGGAEGNNVENPNQYDPPTFIYEWTRSYFYLPSAGNVSDTLLIFDRTNVRNPFSFDKSQLANFSGYSNAYGVVNDPVPTAGSFILTTRYATSTANDKYNGYKATFTSGPLIGVSRIVTDYIGATKTLIFDPPFPSAPNNNDTFDLELLTSGDYGRLNASYADREWFGHIWQAKATPTQGAGEVTWQTKVNSQNCRWAQLLPLPEDSIRDVRVENNTSIYPGGNFPVSELGYQIRIVPIDRFPESSIGVFNVFLNGFTVCDSLSDQPALTLIENAGGQVKGARVSRAGLNDEFVMFSAAPHILTLSSSFSVVLTPTTATSRAFLTNLDPRKTWTYTVNGGSSQSLTVSEAGIGVIPLSSTSAKTIALTAV